MPATVLLKHWASSEVPRGCSWKRKPVFPWKIPVFYMTRKIANHVFPFYREITVCTYLTPHTRPFPLRIHPVAVTQTGDAVAAASFRRQPGSEHLRACAPPFVSRQRELFSPLSWFNENHAVTSSTASSVVATVVQSPCCFCASLLANFPPLSCWGARG